MASERAVVCAGRRDAIAAKLLLSEETERGGETEAWKTDRKREIMLS